MFLGCSEPKDKSIESKTQVALNPELDFRPNILWIVAEDMSPNIPVFGDSTIVTPILNKLAQEGVSYDNFYTPHPVCASARAAIITGMYANSIGASHMRTGPWFSDTITEDIINGYKALPKENIPYEAVPPTYVKMFTEYLRSTGYYCSNNSKEDYQFRKTMTSWDESNEHAHWRNRPKNKPFFAVFNIGVTHESQIWKKRNDSLWVDKNLKIPIPPYLPDTEVAKRDIRRMYSNILEMDTKAGQILKQLEEDNLLDSTIVVWYTDHGGPLPRQKRLLYDSGIKVPMIIRFPNGAFAGLRDDRMISFIDLAPTMLSLAGITTPKHMQGQAFLGKHMRKTEPKFVFGAADRFDEHTDHVRSVRSEKYKYIKNYDIGQSLYNDLAYPKQMPIMQELLQLRKEGSLNEHQSKWFKVPKPKEEFYDLANDPHELTNLANNPKHEETLAKFRNQCENWVTTIDDTGLRPEQELIQRFWPNFKQPKTQKPVFKAIGNTLEISCKTEGASIGYRIISKKDFVRTQGWEVYKEPIEISQNSKVEAVAHRIGYKRSAVVIIETDEL